MSHQLNMFRSRLCFKVCVVSGFLSGHVWQITSHMQNSVSIVSHKSRIYNIRESLHGRFKFDRYIVYNSLRGNEVFFVPSSSTS